MNNGRSLFINRRALTGTRGDGGDGDQDDRKHTPQRVIRARVDSTSYLRDQTPECCEVCAFVAVLMRVLMRFKCDQSSQVKVCMVISEGVGQTDP